MKRSYYTYLKWFTILTTVIVITILGVVTYDVATEGEGIITSDLDFTGKHQIISAYGTLIGGLLAFLSILLVILTIVNQRIQLIKEKQKKKDEQVETYRDRIKLIIAFLSTIINDVKKQGERIKEFIGKEKESPTNMHQMYFSVDSNYHRLLEMDYITNYQAIRHFNRKEDDWEKTFLNLYKNVDFYKEINPHLRDNYESQTKEKVDKKYFVQNQIQIFLEKVNDFRNKYILEYGRQTKELQKYPWFNFINSFWEGYNQYIKKIVETKEDANLTELTKTYFDPFLKEGQGLLNEGIEDQLNSKVLLDDVAKIIVDIKFLETFAENWIIDLDKNYEDYYKDNNKNLTSLEAIKKKFSQSIL